MKRFVALIAASVVALACGAGCTADGGAWNDALKDFRGDNMQMRSQSSVDGDSFAHRAYHALPKSIRRQGNKGGGAIVSGFSGSHTQIASGEGL